MFIETSAKAGFNIKVSSACLVQSLIQRIILHMFTSQHVNLQHCTECLWWSIQGAPTLLTTLAGTL